MNKQELIEGIEAVPAHNTRTRPWIDKRVVLDLIRLLDEPQPVKVPQCVAEKIEYFKKSGDWDLFQAMDYMFGEKEIKEWLEDKDNQETFARAWLDGYEVEEEKRYLVKVKGMSEENTYLTFRFGHTWMLSNFEECEEFRLHHTRKELEEAGFGWVFSCEGIEMEEV